MARYKPYSYGQGKFIPIHFEKQILPGTFEYSLNHLIDWVTIKPLERRGLDGT